MGPNEKINLGTPSPPPPPPPPPPPQKNKPTSPTKKKKKKRNNHMGPQKKKKNRSPAPPPPPPTDDDDDLKGHPFTNEIMEAQLPFKWKGLTIRLYDGSTDPDEHFNVFKTQMNL